MADLTVDDLPRWALTIGPLLVCGAIFGAIYTAFPFEDLGGASEASTVDMLWMLAVIGSIAGIVPVLIGMCWFPIIRDLDSRYLHAFMALSAGVLVFIAVEMVGEVAAYGAAVGNPALATVTTVVGSGGTFLVMHAAGEWRQRQMASREKSGLQIAYLVALALGLHSLGEGLGIGIAYATGDASLVMLLVLAFVMHNVMEGPTIVAAVARDRTTPPLGHFAAMGVIAGGTVILGGWIGSIARSDLLALLFYAVAIGAIGQVLLEIADLIRFDAESALTRTDTATFSVGFALMFFLEDVLTGVLLEGWLVPG